ncbi:hypothetical protein JL722_4185 [Aureococcus anophagefferens]|nr:hypothetical protein JL722_4185 [Aureococcus anophagefferens]
MATTAARPRSGSTVVALQARQAVEELRSHAKFAPLAKYALAVVVEAVGPSKSASERAAAAREVGLGLACVGALNGGARDSADALGAAVLATTRVAPLPGGGAVVAGAVAKATACAPSPRGGPREAERRRRHGGWLRRLAAGDSPLAGRCARSALRFCGVLVATRGLIATSASAAEARADDIDGILECSRLALDVGARELDRVEHDAEPPRTLVEALAFFVVATEAVRVVASDPRRDARSTGVREGDAGPARAAVSAGPQGVGAERRGRAQGRGDLPGDVDRPAGASSDDFAFHGAEAATHALARLAAALYLHEARDFDAAPELRAALKPAVLASRAAHRLSTTVQLDLGARAALFVAGATSGPSARASSTTRPWRRRRRRRRGPRSGPTRRRATSAGRSARPRARSRRSAGLGDDGAAWTQRVDESGVPYFEDGRETTWRAPDAWVRAARAREAPRAATRPSCGAAATGPSASTTAAAYYANEAADLSQWERPDAFGAPPDDGPDARVADDGPDERPSEDGPDSPPKERCPRCWHLRPCACDDDDFEAGARPPPRPATAAAPRAAVRASRIVGFGGGGGDDDAGRGSEGGWDEVVAFAPRGPAPRRRKTARSPPTAPRRHPAAPRRRRTSAGAAPSAWAAAATTPRPSTTRRPSSPTRRPRGHDEPAAPAPAPPAGALPDLPQAAALPLRRGGGRWRWKRQRDPRRRPAARAPRRGRVGAVDLFPSRPRAAAPPPVPPERILGFGGAASPGGQGGYDDANDAAAGPSRTNAGDGRVAGSGGGAVAASSPGDAAGGGRGGPASRRCGGAASSVWAATTRAGSASATRGAAAARGPREPHRRLRRRRRERRRGRPVAAASASDADGVSRRHRPPPPEHCHACLQRRPCACDAMQRWAPPVPLDRILGVGGGGDDGAQLSRRHQPLPPEHCPECLQRRPCPCDEGARVQNDAASVRGSRIVGFGGGDDANDAAAGPSRTQVRGAASSASAAAAKETESDRARRRRSGTRRPAEAPNRGAVQMFDAPGGSTQRAARRGPPPVGGYDDAAGRDMPYGGGTPIDADSVGGAPRTAVRGSRIVGFGGGGEYDDPAAGDPMAGDQGGASPSVRGSRIVGYGGGDYDDPAADALGGSRGPGHGPPPVGGYDDAAGQGRVYGGGTPIEDPRRRPATAAARPWATRQERRAQPCAGAASSASAAAASTTIPRPAIRWPAIEETRARRCEGVASSATAAAATTTIRRRRSGRRGLSDAPGGSAHAARPRASAGRGYDDAAGRDMPYGGGTPIDADSAGAPHGRARSRIVGFGGGGEYDDPAAGDPMAGDRGDAGPSVRGSRIVGYGGGGDYDDPAVGDPGARGSPALGSAQRRGPPRASARRGYDDAAGRDMPYGGGTPIDADSVGARARPCAEPHRRLRRRREYDDPRPAIRWPAIEETRARRGAARPRASAVGGYDDAAGRDMPYGGGTPIDADSVGAPRTAVRGSRIVGGGGEYDDPRPAIRWPAIEETRARRRSAAHGRARSRIVGFGGGGAPRTAVRSRIVGGGEYDDPAAGDPMAGDRGDAGPSVRGSRIVGYGGGGDYDDPAVGDPGAAGSPTLAARRSAAARRGPPPVGGYDDAAGRDMPYGGGTPIDADSVGAPRTAVRGAASSASAAASTTIPRPAIRWPAIEETRARRAAAAPPRASAGRGYDDAAGRDMPYGGGTPIDADSVGAPRTAVRGAASSASAAAADDPAAGDPMAGDQEVRARRSAAHGRARSRIVGFGGGGDDDPGRRSDGRRSRRRGPVGARSRIVGYGGGGDYDDPAVGDPGAAGLSDAPGGSAQRRGPARASARRGYDDAAGRDMPYGGGTPIDADSVGAPRTAVRGAASSASAAASTTIPRPAIRWPAIEETRARRAPRTAVRGSRIVGFGGGGDDDRGRRSDGRRSRRRGPVGARSRIVGYGGGGDYDNPAVGDPGAAGLSDAPGGSAQRAARRASARRGYDDAAGRDMPYGGGTPINADSVGAPRTAVRGAASSASAAAASTTIPRPAIRWLAIKETRARPCEGAASSATAAAATTTISPPAIRAPRGSPTLPAARRSGRGPPRASAGRGYDDAAGRDMPYGGGTPIDADSVGGAPRAAVRGSRIVGFGGGGEYDDANDAAAGPSRTNLRDSRMVGPDRGTETPGESSPHRRHGGGGEGGPFDTPGARDAAGRDLGGVAPADVPSSVRDASAPAVRGSRIVGFGGGEDPTASGDLGADDAPGGGRDGRARGAPPAGGYDDAAGPGRAYGGGTPIDAPGVSAVDPATGATYYSNPDTGESSWTRPLDGFGGGSAASGAGDRGAAARAPADGRDPSSALAPDASPSVRRSRIVGFGGGGEDRRTAAGRGRTPAPSLARDDRDPASPHAASEEDAATPRATKPVAGDTPASGPWRCPKCGKGNGSRRSACSVCATVRADDAAAADAGPSVRGSRIVGMGGGDDDTVDDDDAGQRERVYGGGTPIEDPAAAPYGGGTPIRGGAADPTGVRKSRIVGIGGGGGANPAPGGDWDETVSLVPPDRPPADIGSPWREFVDPLGVPYFHNDQTQETTWIAPDDWVRDMRAKDPVQRSKSIARRERLAGEGAPRAAVRGSRIVGFGGGSDDPAAGNPMAGDQGADSTGVRKSRIVGIGGGGGADPAQGGDWDETVSFVPPARPPADIGSPWREFVDPLGVPYFHNDQTQETTWIAPDDWSRIVGMGGGDDDDDDDEGPSKVYGGGTPIEDVAAAPGEAGRGRADEAPSVRKSRIVGMGGGGDDDDDDEDLASGAGRGRSRPRIEAADEAPSVRKSRIVGMGGGGDDDDDDAGPGKVYGGGTPIEDVAAAPGKADRGRADRGRADEAPSVRKSRIVGMGGGGDDDDDDEGPSKVYGGGTPIEDVAAAPGEAGRGRADEAPSVRKSRIVGMGGGGDDDDDDEDLARSTAAERPSRTSQRRRARPVEAADEAPSVYGGGTPIEDVAAAPGEAGRGRADEAPSVRKSRIVGMGGGGDDDDDDEGPSKVYGGGTPIEDVAAAPGEAGRGRADEAPSVRKSRIVGMGGGGDDDDDDEGPGKVYGGGTPIEDVAAAPGEAAAPGKAGRGRAGEAPSVRKSRIVGMGGGDDDDDDDAGPGKVYGGGTPIVAGSGDVPEPRGDGFSDDGGDDDGGAAVVRKSRIVGMGGDGGDARPGARPEHHFLRKGDGRRCAETRAVADELRRQDERNRTVWRRRSSIVSAAKALKGLSAARASSTTRRRAARDLRRAAAAIRGAVARPRAAKFAAGERRVDAAAAVRRLRGRRRPGPGLPRRAKKALLVGLAAPLATAPAETPPAPAAKGGRRRSDRHALTELERELLATIDAMSRELKDAHERARDVETYTRSGDLSDLDATMAKLKGVCVMLTGHEKGRLATMIGSGASSSPTTI